MSIFQQKITRCTKKQEMVGYTQAKKKSVNRNWAIETTQMLALAEKDFKVTIINMFKEVKETTFRELKYKKN